MLARHTHKLGSWYDENGKEHSLFAYSHARNFLLRKSWDAQKVALGDYLIHSTFETKKFIHHLRKDNPSDWVPGINLATFVALNGVYPSTELIRHHILAMRNYKHNDLWIANIVIQGNDLVLIDCQDSRRNANFKKYFKKLVNQFS